MSIRLLGDSWVSAWFQSWDEFPRIRAETPGTHVEMAGLDLAKTIIIKWMAEGLLPPSDWG